MKEIFMKINEEKNIIEKNLMEEKREQKLSLIRYTWIAPLGDPKINYYYDDENDEK